MSNPEVGYPSYDDWKTLEPDERLALMRADLYSQPFTPEYSRMVGQNALRELIESVNDLSELDIPENRPLEIL